MKAPQFVLWVTVVLGVCSGLYLWAFRSSSTQPIWAHDWARDVAERGDLTALADWRRQAPQAAHAHPTPEHFLPLLMAVGALGGAPMTTLHESFSFGNLSMLCLAAGETANALAA